MVGLIWKASTSKLEFVMAPQLKILLSSLSGISDPAVILPEPSTARCPEVGTLTTPTAVAVAKGTSARLPVVTSSPLASGRVIVRAAVGVQLSVPPAPNSNWVSGSVRRIFLNVLDKPPRNRGLSNAIFFLSYRIVFLRYLLSKI